MSFLVVAPLVKSTDHIRVGIIHRSAPVLA
jgi:hypothetical protein